jgi:hypothetical protein
MDSGERRSAIGLGDREWPIWVTMAALPLTLPFVSLFYSRRLLNSGTLNPDADSIAIPIMNDLTAAFLIAPVVLAVTWACLWRYDGGAVLFGWDRDRPWRAVAATVSLGLPALGIAGSVAADIFAALPWYEYSWDGYFSLWAIWLLLLRAALLAPPAARSEDAWDDGIELG